MKIKQTKSVVSGALLAISLSVMSVFVAFTSPVAAACSDSDISACTDSPAQCEAHGGVLTTKSVPGLGDIPECVPSSSQCTFKDIGGCNETKCKEFKADWKDGKCTEPSGGRKIVDETTGECGKAQTVIIKCDSSSETGAKGSPIWSILKLAINILTGGIGIVAVGGIVYGSILYTSAGADTAQTKKAVSVITNVVIGLIAYALMYAVLNFIIPGGLFS